MVWICLIYLSYVRVEITCTHGNGPSGSEQYTAELLCVWAAPQERPMTTKLLDYTKGNGNLNWSFCFR